MGKLTPPAQPWYKNGWNWFAIVTALGIGGQLALVNYAVRCCQKQQEQTIATKR